MVKNTDNFEKLFLKTIKYLYSKYNLDINYIVYIKDTVDASDEFILHTAKGHTSEGFVANISKQVKVFDEEDN